MYVYHILCCCVIVQICVLVTFFLIHAHGQVALAGSP